MWVICLCAQWCDVCREYRSAFEGLATNWPEARFRWIDIEDDEDLMGDVEVETFPTLLLAQGHRIHFFGPLPPQIEVLRQLIKKAHSPDSVASPAAAQALLLRIQKSPP